MSTLNFTYKSQFRNRVFGIEIRTRLISAPDGCFPRARLQSPRHYVPAGLSVGEE